MRKSFLLFLLVPTLLFPQQRANVVPDLIVKSNAWYDIRAYGAISGDAASDVVAIQAALDSCNSSGGGIVYLPPGTWNIDDPLQIYSNTTVKGSGIGATTLQASDASNLSYMLTLDNCSKAIISDIRFDNNYANQTGGANLCIYTQDTVSYLTIKDCEFEGNGRSASGYAVWLNQAFNAIIDNIIVDGWDEGDCIVINNSEWINVKNSNFKNLQYSAISLTANARNCNISNNFFYNIGDETAARGHAVYISNGSYSANKENYPTDIIVSNNIANRCFGDVIICQWAQRCIISNNHITGYWIKADGDSTGDTGISCNAQGSVISGNYVAGMGAPGITIFDEDDGVPTNRDIIVIGNSLWNNGFHSDPSQLNRQGIWIDDSEGCLIIGNMSGNSADSINTSWRGLYTGSYASDKNTIIGNVFTRNRDHGFYFVTPIGEQDSNVVIGNYVFPDTGTILIENPKVTNLATSDGNKMTFTFYWDSLTVGMNNVQIHSFGGADSGSYRMPQSGSVLGMVVAINDSVTGGSLIASIEEWNASTGYTVTLDSLDIISQSWAKDIIKFDALSTLSIQITTSGSWAIKNSPIKACLEVTLLVEM